MSWSDRLQEAAYTGPVSGNRITFEYEDVSREIDKKTTGFEFADADGTYVQDSGATGRRYPLRAIFWGDNCDLEADAFEGLLLEKGVGRLEHPMYGTVDVVPFGKIDRSDALKTAANQAIVEVTLWATVGIVYPTAQNDPGSLVLDSLGSFNAAAADDFADVLLIDKAAERVGFRNVYETLLLISKNGLQSVANAEDSVRQKFEGIYSSINQGIETLIGAPLDLTFQTLHLVQAPALAPVSIFDRLKAYRALAESLVNDQSAATGPGRDSQALNTFRTNDLFVSAYLTGQIASVVNNQFLSKTDALLAAEEVLSLFEAAVAWRDERFSTLIEIDTGTSYQQLQESVALTAGFLVFISFSLKQERRIILDRSRTIIDLVAELYGGIDTELDFFITSNSLTGSEILELPAGREIVYYV